MNPSDPSGNHQEKLSSSGPEVWDLECDTGCVGCPVSSQTVTPGFGLWGTSTGPDALRTQSTGARNSPTLAGGGLRGSPWAITNLQTHIHLYQCNTWLSLVICKVPAIVRSFYLHDLTQSQKIVNLKNTPRSKLHYYFLLLLSHFKVW